MRGARSILPPFLSSWGDIPHPRSRCRCRIVNYFSHFTSFLFILWQWILFDKSQQEDNGSAPPLNKRNIALDLTSQAHPDIELGVKSLSHEGNCKSPGGYFLFSTEGWVISSDLSFDSSEVSFDSSEEFFLSSEEWSISSGAIWEVPREESESSER